MNWMSFVLGAVEQYLRLSLGDKAPDDTMRQAHDWGRQFARWLKQQRA